MNTALAENIILKDEFQNYDVPITRYEVVTVISRFIDISDVEKNKNIFKDLDDKYEESTLKLVKLKIVNGYTDKTFKGENYITRAEAVTILKRALSAKSKIISNKKYDVTERSDLSNYRMMMEESHPSGPTYEIQNDEQLVIYDSGRYSNLQGYMIDNKLIEIAKVINIIKNLIRENSYTMITYIPSKYTINQLKIAYGESEDKIEKGGFDFAITYYEDKEYELARISMEEKFSEKCYMKIEVLKLWSSYSDYLKGIYIDDYKKEQLRKVLNIEFGSSNANKILKYILEKNELYVSNQSKDKDYVEVKKVGNYVVNFYQPMGETPKFFVSKSK
ncbi:MAG: S-layer homology domain-containing protein [Clostridia bacterium]|nr:S-layer homology domain-containing protein [Clostridia bacterium]